jgi:hypothetical protein
MLRVQKAFKQHEVANLWQQLDEYSRLKEEDDNGSGKASEDEYLILHFDQMTFFECFCGFRVNKVLELTKLHILMWLKFGWLLLHIFGKRCICNGSLKHSICLFD